MIIRHSAKLGRLFLAASLLATSLTVAAEPATTVPAPRDGNWVKRHEGINGKVKAQPDSEVIFIGDSITDAWSGPGKKAWTESFGKYKPLNLGIGGDRTQHVLWRLENGNIEGLKPKAAVIMIGTNNTGSDSAEDIAAGVGAIVTKLRKDLPETKILLLAVFPRGEKPNPQREKIAVVNGIIAKLDDGKHVHYLDIGPNFVGEDGVIVKDIMPDFLHLSPKAYGIWAEAITPKLEELTK